jgi:sigma-E factor negative regulatory protein RseA
MVTDRAEQVSALMDGELQGEALQHALDELKCDAGLKGCWGRYHLISDVLHNHASVQLSHSRNDSIMPLSGKTHTMRGWHSRRIIKPLAGFALAASVAALAIFSVQTFVFISPGIDTSQLAALSSPSVAASPVSTQSQGARWESAKPAFESRLNHYLTNHNEYSTSAGLQGMLPHARIVAYDADK